VDDRQGKEKKNSEIERLLAEVSSIIVPHWAASHLEAGDCRGCAGFDGTQLAAWHRHPRLRSRTSACSWGSCRSWPSRLARARSSLSSWRGPLDGPGGLETGDDPYLR
jgi:hypothetical protein